MDNLQHNGLVIWRGRRETANGETSVPIRHRLWCAAPALSLHLSHRGKCMEWNKKTESRRFVLVALKLCATLCTANIQLFPFGPGCLLIPPPPVIEAAAQPLDDLCDFVKQFSHSGVLESTRKTDAHLGSGITLRGWGSCDEAYSHLQPREALGMCGAVVRWAAGGVLKCCWGTCCWK